MTENIEVFTQSSIRIKGNEGVIYADPFKVPRAFNDADFILITHDHSDHYSPDDIAKVIKSDTVIIVPQKMTSQLSRDISDYKEIAPVCPGEEYEIEGLKFETIPSYNNAKQFHPKNAGWVGYVISVDGRRIYISGDMDATDEARAVKCDIAMIPIGGHFTMDATEAADLINTMKPTLAIPTHYGSIVGSPADGEKFKKLVDENIKVEIKL